MKKILLIHLLILFSLTVQAENSFSDLNTAEQQQLESILTSSNCSCGCEKKILNCINTDPSCTTAPEMAKSVIDEIVNARQSYQYQPRQHSRPEIYNYDGGGGFVSGTNSEGQNCSYVSVPGAGSMRVCD